MTDKYNLHLSHSLITLHDRRQLFDIGVSSSSFPPLLKRDRTQHTGDCTGDINYVIHREQKQFPATQVFGSSIKCLCSFFLRL